MAQDFIKRFTKFYFGSWFMPLCGLIGATFIHGAVNTLLWKVLGPSQLALEIFWVAPVVFSLFIVVAIIYQFAKRLWLKGTFNLLVLIFIMLLGTLPFYLRLDSHDDFGKDIVIPKDMAVENPLEEIASVGSAAVDAESNEFVHSFKKVTDIKTDYEELYLNCGYLEKFSGEERKILLRHLATSCKWFLSREHGKLYAYRRFVVNGSWRNSLNGYYTHFDFPASQVSDSRHFQVRVAICPDGTVFAEPWKKKVTVLKATDAYGRLKVVEDKQFKQGKESYLVVRGTLGAIEIFEQSPYFQRVFTPLVLEKLSREFAAVLNSKDAQLKGFAASLLPPESIKKGNPEIHVINGMQGGIYFVQAYINPGEEGYVYLKVFEATKNTPLSVGRIKECSQEYIGCSDNPQEQFYYNTEVTVYEGNWGVYYPARFELWFVPADGSPERKLIEKIFKIEGWQR